MNAPDFAIQIAAKLRKRADELDAASQDARLCHEAADFIEAERIRIHALQRMVKAESAVAA